MTNVVRYRNDMDEEVDPSQGKADGGKNSRLLSGKSKVVGAPVNGDATNVKIINRTMAWT